MHLFLDAPKIACRTLPENAWQIYCDDGIAKRDVHSWAQKIILLMIETMQGKNMVAFEFVSELRNLLNKKDDKRFVVRLVPLDRAKQLSEGLADSNIKDAWVALFSHTPSMDQYSEMVALFEGVVHADGRLLCSTNISQQDGEYLMLLTAHTAQ